VLHLTTHTRLDRRTCGFKRQDVGDHDRYLGGNNLYAFVGGATLSLIDPLGLCGVVRYMQGWTQWWADVLTGLAFADAMRMPGLGDELWHYTKRTVTGLPGATWSGIKGIASAVAHPIRTKNAIGTALGEGAAFGYLVLTGQESVDVAQWARRLDPDSVHNVGMGILGSLPVGVGGAALWARAASVWRGFTAVGATQAGAQVGTEVAPALLRRVVGAGEGGEAAQAAAAAGGARQTLYHYTTDAGRAGILESGEIWASQGARNARHGAGQYFTDIAPEAIGGRTLATTPAGQMSLGQLSSRLFRVPWNTGKLSSFLEVDVAGLGARQVAPNIWLIEGEAGLSIGGRVVRSGATLP
jgi:hypothetical protein